MQTFKNLHDIQNIKHFEYRFDTEFLLYTEAYQLAGQAIKNIQKHTKRYNGI